VNIKLQKSELERAMDVIKHTYLSRPETAILSGVMITAEQDGVGDVAFCGTDMKIAIECVVKAEVIEGGRIVVSRDYLYGLVGRLPECEVIISSISEREVMIRYENSVVTIKGYDTETFPEFVMGEWNEKGAIDFLLFADMIKKIEFACASVSGGGVLSGILLELEESKLALVATDRYRLSIVETMINNKEVTYRAIIPQGVMQKMSLLAKYGMGKVRIGGDEKQIVFKVANITVLARIIDGQYPDYEKVLPDNEKCACCAEVDRRELINTLSRAAVIAADSGVGNARIVCLDWREGEIIVTAKSSIVGSIREKVFAYMDGMLGEVYFDIRYLLDALKAIEEERVLIFLLGQNNACVIVPETHEAHEGRYDRQIHLIVPVRIK